MTTVFRVYRPRQPQTKAEIKKRAAKLRRELSKALFDNPLDLDDPHVDELWVAARDAWQLLGYVAGPVSDPKKQKWTDQELVTAATKAAARVQDERAGHAKTLDILQTMCPDKRLPSEQALRKRLPRLGRFTVTE
jgi:hypothetical protein